MISNSNWTEWSTIQGVIARVISKSDEREARGRFEITSTITPKKPSKRGGEVEKWENRKAGKHSREAEKHGSWEVGKRGRKEVGKQGREEA